VLGYSAVHNKSELFKDFGHAFRLITLFCFVLSVFNYEQVLLYSTGHDDREVLGSFWIRFSYCF
jgi:hypothetical protein